MRLDGEVPPQRTSFPSVTATPDEVAASRPGDDLVPGADVVMDRGATLPGSPEAVWPWVVQLGKQRAGWYLPRSVERLVPGSRRASRRVDERWQGLRVGDVIPDYGGSDATFEVALLERPHSLVYVSTRGHTDVSWALTLSPVPGSWPRPQTRLHLRLRLGPVRRRWAAEYAGGWFDGLTVAGMVAGLNERLAEQPVGR